MHNLLWVIWSYIMQERFTDAVEAKLHIEHLVYSTFYLTLANTNRAEHFIMHWSNST
jgi:hypothetical protein